MKTKRTTMSRAGLASLLMLLGLTLGWGSCLLVLGEIEASGQGILRQVRPQRRIGQPPRRGPNRLATGAEPAKSPEQETPAAAKPSVRPTQHSLDGIRQKGLIGFFSPDEAAMIIRGFGRPPSYLIILRQLDLTAEQKEAIRGISRRVGTRLAALRLQTENLDQQLEETIYGESFNQKQAEDLARRVGEVQAEATRLQAGIEMEFREILTPDQFYVFRALIGEMLLPQRRIPPGQLRPQGLPRRLNPPVNGQPRPEPLIPE